MSRTFEMPVAIARSILKKYRKQIFTPFITAVKRYALLAPGDKVAVCISGGKDSMLMAVLMKELQKISDFPFDLVYLVMDPGYRPENRAQIAENGKKLGLPLTFFETDIFSVADQTEKNPCYLCARMRRGFLYAKAKELGCNKIALGHHRNDVIETTVMAMFYGAQLQAMPPRLRSTNFPGMELIRPLYCIREDDILAWKRYNQLEFLQCACRLTEQAAQDTGVSKRKEVKVLIRTLSRDNPNLENNIFNSIHNVCLDTFVSYKQNGVFHPFTERFAKEIEQTPSESQTETIGKTK